MEAIKNITDFQRTLSQRSKDIFVDQPDENMICEIDFSSDILLVLPRTNDLANIRYYKNVEFISINNYKIDKKKIKILEQNAELLKQVTHLHIWNNKQDDLSLLQFFPNLTHLLISYIRKEEYFFKELELLPYLDTLCLFGPSRLENLQFLKYIKSDLKVLALESTKALKSFSGLENVPSLQSLSLWGSTYESAKYIVLDNVNSIETLSNLKELELKFYKFDSDDLKFRLKGLKHLENYTVDKDIISNN